jgi:hypothetical protein
MKRLTIVAGLLFCYVALASDLWVGRLFKASGSVNNSTTTDDAGTFKLFNPQSVGAHYAIQCLTDSCVATSADAGIAVGCANQGINPAVATPAEAIAGGLLFDIPLAPKHTFIAAISVDGGQVSCDVYSVAQMPGN